MARSNPALTTTTYAILGQLAWGEATTYELVKAMGRNLRFVWPRAESRIYAEAKRLVDAGLVSARKERTGRRPRTVYAITDEGRAALAEQQRQWATVTRTLNDVLPGGMMTALGEA